MVINIATQIDTVKLDYVIDQLLNSPQHNKESRIVMNQLTAEALHNKCLGTDSRPPYRYGIQNGCCVYNGIQILRDDTLNFGEVLVLGSIKGINQ